MKKRICFSLFFAIFAIYSVTCQNSSINRKLLITLEPSEKIVYGENRLNIMSTTDQIYLVTTMDKNIYVYENGQKRGPYGDFEEAKIRQFNNDDEFNNKCSIYELPNTEINADVLTTNDDGTFSIKLNKKSYGPYGLISQLHVWPDKSGFVALTYDKDMKSSLITESVTLALNGDIEKLNFSPNGKKYVFALKERQAIDMDIMKIDFSKMTQEEMIAFAKKQEEKAKSAPKLQSYIYVNGTTKLGPYELNAFYSNNPAFTKTGGENWIMTLDNALYINGEKIKDYPDVDLNTCRIWVSNDGKKYAIISYNKIIFSDGKEYANPIEPLITEKNGKINVSWVSLENEKEIVSYSREL